MHDIAKDSIHLLCQGFRRSGLRSLWLQFEEPSSLGLLTPTITVTYFITVSYSIEQTAEFRRRRYLKTSVRGEIRPKIGNFWYSSDIRVVLPEL